MQRLTDQGQQVVNDVAQRHGVSSDAVYTLLMALSAGGGTQAQFSHPELGGMGQWSMGGMTMVGDMFNNGLKYQVDSLCSELSGILANSTMFAPPAQSQSQSQSGGGMNSGMGGGVSLFVSGQSPGNWWPQDLGQASSTGSQNNLRYALFPNSRRLAIDINGQVTVYDTLDHQISGFSQQQSGDQSITFNSQYGLVRVSDLPIISPAGSQAQFQPPQQPPMPAPQEPAQGQPQQPYGAQGAPTNDEAGNSATEDTGGVIDNATSPAPTPAPAPVPTSAPTSNSSNAGSVDEIFGLIEKLADLKERGILTDQEFEAKKTDLLGRL